MIDTDYTARLRQLVEQCRRAARNSFEVEAKGAFRTIGDELSAMADEFERSGGSGERRPLRDAPPNHDKQHTAFFVTPSDSGRQRPRHAASPTAKPRKVKDYSDDAGKPELRRTAWWWPQSPEGGLGIARHDNREFFAFFW
jgi:hypothetical protein